MQEISTSILSQNSKNLKGEPLGKIFFPKKVSQCRKKLKGGPFGRVRYCMLRGKPFWFSSLGQQVQFRVFLKYCGTFGITILVTSDVSKNKTGTSKVGAISKAQNAQKTFKKNLKFLIFFLSEKVA